MRSLLLITALLLLPVLGFSQTVISGANVNSSSPQVSLTLAAPASGLTTIFVGLATLITSANDIQSMTISDNQGSTYTCAPIYDYYSSTHASIFCIATNVTVNPASNLVISGQVIDINGQVATTTGWSSITGGYINGTASYAIDGTLGVNFTGNYSTLSNSVTTTGTSDFLVGFTGANNAADITNYDGIGNNIDLNVVQEGNPASGEAYYLGYLTSQPPGTYSYAVGSSSDKAVYLAALKIQSTPSNGKGRIVGFRID